MNERFRRLLQLALAGSRRNWNAVIVAFCFIAITALFLVPIVPGVLDLLFVFNIVLSLTILLRGVFARDATELLSFPLLLLITTLFRLGLNVSSTRLILSHGEEGVGAAGRVIEAFGTLVAQGDPAVGAIVFSVIALVNFLVITKGAGRVAEVSARFSLDSLPGKQLAIDADLRSGSISREEAEARRSLLGRESQFFGSMDGAMRFVQGDAIACLLIVVLNAVGGTVIGIVQHGLDFSVSVRSYGVLALGDGLVSILPALLISVAAGVVVTNVSGKREGGFESGLVPQILAEPTALLLSGGAVLLLGVAGLFSESFPPLPFLLVGAGMTAFALRANRVSESTTGRGQLSLPGGADRGGSTELTLELEESVVIRYLTPPNSQPRPFRQFAQAERDRVFQRLGIRVPELSLVSRDDLPRGTYRVLVRGQMVRQGTVDESLVFAALSPATLRAFGVRAAVPGTHPLDLRRGMWLDATTLPEEFFSSLGVEVLEPYEFLVLECIAACLTVVDELFGVDEVKGLVAELRSRHPQLVEEMLSREMITIPELAQVLRHLVREEVGIRDLKLICEGIAEFYCLRPSEEDRQEWLIELHGFLRARLARSIVRDSSGPGDKLRVFFLSPELESEFRAASSVWDRVRGGPPLDFTVETNFRETVSKIMTPLTERGNLPLVVLCAGDVRPAVQEVLRRAGGGAGTFRTLAYEELEGRVTAECVGVIAA